MTRLSWNKQEDREVLRLVQLHGEENWAVVAEGMASAFGPRSRSAKQCRERWSHHLAPRLSSGPWDQRQQQLLFQKQGELGNRWKQIAEFFPGRSDNSVKNHYYSTLRKCLRRLLKDSDRRVDLRAIRPFVLSKILESEESRIRAALLEMGRTGKKTLEMKLDAQFLKELDQTLAGLNLLNRKYLEAKEERSYEKRNQKKRKYTKSKAKASPALQTAVKLEEPERIPIPTDLMTSSLFKFYETQLTNNQVVLPGAHEVESAEVDCKGPIEPGSLQGCDSSNTPVWMRESFNCSSLSNFSALRGAIK